MTSSLVGSEMCIRDSRLNLRDQTQHQDTPSDGMSPRQGASNDASQSIGCLLYTSDAADDM
eukprot:2540495-Prorocentrum_lima.AAC.1